MRREPKNGSRLRIISVLVFLYLALGVVCFKSYRLQVVNSESLKAIAKKQYLTRTTLRFPRGVIYDRNLEELAVSKKSYSIYAHTRQAHNPRETALRLSRILEMSPREIESRLKSKDPFVWIARSVSEEQGLAIKSLIPKKAKSGEKQAPNPIPGIGVQDDESRFYPGGELGAHVLGFAGIDGQGLEGIEKYYDNYLKGEPVSLLVERDALGHIRMYVDNDVPKPRPASLVLTIDQALQNLAEHKLKETVDKFNARRGALIAMDPNSGAILALALYPGFNPNYWYAYQSRNWRNWAVTEVYEPGSTFKVFVLASALEEKRVSINDELDCENGSYVVNGDTIHDMKPYGRLRIPQVLSYSSNIGMAKVAEKLGASLLYQHLSEFGFGKKTGIDFPGERDGMLRPYQKWYPITLRTIGFGQGVSVTPLQMLVALCAIANGGELLQPYLAEKLIFPDGAERILHRRNMVARVLSKETAFMMRELMTEVVNSGTGKLAQIPGYKVAGKTGTAQKPAPSEEGGGYYKDRWVCSFMGFAPADNPKIAMIVIIDEPKADMATGGMIAAPVFQEVTKYALTSSGEIPEASAVADLKAVLPVESGLEQAVKPLEAGSNTGAEPGVIPEFRGMTLLDALRLSFSLGQKVVIEGSGWVVEQSPLPGSPATEKIRLRLSQER